MEGKSAHIAVGPEATLATGLTDFANGALRSRALWRQAMDGSGFTGGYELS
jgi:hypothetical protein